MDIGFHDQLALGDYQICLRRAEIPEYAGNHVLRLCLAGPSAYQRNALLALKFGGGLGRIEGKTLRCCGAQQFAATIKQTRQFFRRRLGPAHVFAVVDLLGVAQREGGHQHLAQGPGATRRRRALSFQQAGLECGRKFDGNAHLGAAVGQRFRLDHRCTAYQAVDITAGSVVLAGKGADRRTFGKTKVIHLYREIAQGIALGGLTGQQFLLRCR